MKQTIDAARPSPPRNRGRRGNHRRGRRSSHRRRRSWRSSPIWALTCQLLRVTALVLLIVAASLVPVLWPPTDRPGRADAVFVLSGDFGERRALAFSLVERGLVPVVVFVGTPDRGSEDELCRSKQRVEYICLRPSPDNTRAEARAASHLARSRHWQSVVVVTSRFHVARSRMLFRRCFGGSLSVMGGDPPYDRTFLRRQIRGEWPKVLYTAAVARTC